MDEIIKSIATQLPMVAIVTYMLYIVYRDGRADRQYMMSLLEKIYLSQKSIGGESRELGDDTLSKRP